MFDLDLEVAIDFIKRETNNSQECASSLLLAVDGDEDFSVHKISFNLRPIIAAMRKTPFFQ